jgi:hypothetical protein
MVSDIPATVASELAVGKRGIESAIGEWKLENFRHAVVKFLRKMPLNMERFGDGQVQ